MQEVGCRVCAPPVLTPHPCSLPLSVWFSSHMSTPRDAHSLVYPWPPPAEWRSADRLRLLRQQMRDAVPLVAEANALSKALGKPVVLSLHLVPLYSMFCFPPATLGVGARAGGDGGGGAGAGDQWVEEVSSEDLRRRFDREVR